MLNGKLASTTTYTLNRSRRPTLPDKFTECELYHRLQPYILSHSQLAENGYPSPSPDKTGCAVILKEVTKKPASNDETERLCCRCGKTYRMTSKGKYITQEECVYHWGKPRKTKLGGAWVTRYDCCQGESNLDGCCVAKLHVHDAKSLSGFVHTMPRTPPTDGNYGVYALDCEMAYTTEGFELTRVTVVSTALEPVFETLVKPDHRIIDYNTRFSGITDSDMAGVKMTLRDVQAILLNRFNSQTILIGHSLESDLLALKIIHKTVVDTSVVFPHRLGAPYKRALRNLMVEYVKKIIQQNVNGHDSQEDANACMELMIWKLKEDAKLGTAVPL